MQELIKGYAFWMFRVKLFKTYFTINAMIRSSPSQFLNQTISAPSNAEAQELSAWITCISVCILWFLNFEFTHAMPLYIWWQIHSTCSTKCWLHPIWILVTETAWFCRLWWFGFKCSHFFCRRKVRLLPFFVYSMKRIKVILWKAWFLILK